MKLVFTKLETDANEIKVTFDGSTWRPYSVADIKRTGYIEFSEEDCPDLTKIKIKGKFARFNSVESVSDVELEQGVASRSLAESVQRIDSFIPSTVSEINKLVDEATLNDSLLDIENKLGLKVDSLILLSENTDGTHTTYNSRKFSAYRMLVFNIGASTTDVRDTCVVNTNSFLTGEKIIFTLLHGVTSSKASDFSVSTANIACVSDTTYSVTFGGAKALKYIECVGLR